MWLGITIETTVRVNLIYLKTVIQAAEKRYVSDEVTKHKNNSSFLWKIINRCVPSRKKDSQTYSKDQKVMAEEFNQFFASVGSRAAEAALSLATVHNIELSNPLLATPHHPPDELFNFRPLTRLEVKSVILSVPSNKSSGPDEVGIRVIKDCLTEILDPLTGIITAYLSYLRFLTRGKFPKLYHC